LFEVGEGGTAALGFEELHRQDVEGLQVLDCLLDLRLIEPVEELEVGELVSRGGGGEVKVVAAEGGEEGGIVVGEFSSRWGRWVLGGGRGWD